MADLVNTPDEGNPSAVDAPVNDIPEHLQGKAPAELADMYRNLEKKLGAQSEELGQLRQLANQALLQDNGSSDTVASSDDDFDFYTDPLATVQREVKRQLEPFAIERQAQREQTTAGKLDTNHPGWKDMVQTENFQQWVAGSKFRVNLYTQGSSGDYDAADELLSTWKGLGNAQSVNQDVAEKAVKRDRKLRAVSTEKGAAGIDPRKILNRADLRDLRRTNPQRYNDLLPDIRKAYAEGRVK